MHSITVLVSISKNSITCLFAMCTLDNIIMTVRHSYVPHSDLSSSLLVDVCIVILCQYISIRQQQYILLYTVKCNIVATLIATVLFRRYLHMASLQQTSQIKMSLSKPSLLTKSNGICSYNRTVQEKLLI